MAAEVTNLSAFFSPPRDPTRAYREWFAVSEVFVGIVVKSSAERVRSVATRFAGVPVEIVDVKPDAAVVSCRTPRNDRTFENRADEIAAEFSRELEAALVVRYDSRVGLRTSRLYRGGAVAAEFGECNEMYVPIDE